MINSTGNPKIHPMWVKSRDFGFNLMKYWLKSSAFTWKVRLILSCLSLADRATWNPGKNYSNQNKKRRIRFNVFFFFYCLLPFLFSKQE